MKKIVLTLALALPAALLSSAAATASAPAEPAGGCHRVGTANIFAYAGEPVDVEFGEVSTFPEVRCNPRGIRVYKAYANTSTEVAELRSFASQNDKVKYLMALCVESPTRAHIVDFAYFYYFHMKSIRAVEKRGYVRWLDNYAARHDCRIY